MPTRDFQLLLVDDDPSAIHTMRVLLAEYPNQRFAMSGPAALELAAASPPDLIVLDANLPGMSGLEVCDALQANPRLADIPVIMATGYDVTELEVAALERGASDFVTKPLQPDQFLARVRAQLSVNRTPPELLRGELARHAGNGEPARGDARLLIIDDDASSIHFLRHALSALGSFHFATSGAKALQLAKWVVPDLILLDVHMPKMDGFEVCSALKALPSLSHVPIVFVTRYSDIEHEMRALDLGAADFVSKPYTPAVLRARVRNLLELKRRNDAELHALGERWSQLGDARVAEIVQAASDGIISSDSDGMVVLANEAAGALLGVSLDRMIGRPLAEVTSEIAGPLDPTERGPVQALLHRPDGTSVAVEVSVSQLRKEHLQLTTLVIRDITSRERLEAHARARSAAEASSLTKSRMLAYIAHEMGNPLNGIQGFLQLLRADTLTPLSTTQARWADLALDSTQRLGSLLRDLLDTGRGDGSDFGITVQAVDLSSVVAQAVELVSSQGVEAGVSVRSVRADEKLYVLADPQRTHQCLVNLLSNAIKYNLRGGWVEVAATADSREVHVSVSDNGIGMNTQQIEQLFMPFNRLGRQIGAKIQGMGLGLVIARQLVEAMSGRLLVQSVEGSGSTFTIVLPRWISPDCAQDGRQ